MPLASSIPIYGYHICFCDEEEVQGRGMSGVALLEGGKVSNRHIAVCRSPAPICSDMFSIVTEWYDMSGQKARYCANTSFKDADAGFAWALEIRGVMMLLWEPSERTIYYTPKAGYSKARLQFWIYHTFFPMVLELMRRYTVLHVGGVEVAGVPILFSAPSFGGKSTMVDYFVNAGHTLYSDDSLAIEKSDRSYLAVASYPYHRPYRKPEVLGYRVKRFGVIPQPVGALYLLDKQEGYDGIEIVALKGIEKYKAFHHSIFIEFSFRKQERFLFFSEMARHIPVFRIRYPHDMQRLGEVYSKIVMHVESTQSLRKV